MSAASTTRRTPNGSPPSSRNLAWNAHRAIRRFVSDAKERAVELVEGGPKFAAKITGASPTARSHVEPAVRAAAHYNAYSIDGEVTAPLVYVNYGIPEDYERLERMAFLLRAKSSSRRYYHSWRGIKPKVAAEHGAVGCLIFSDPHEDASFKAKRFPLAPGAERRRTARQRRGYAVLSRRSADAGRGRHKKRHAPED